MFGRNSESPVPVIAAATPSDCFDAALEAARIAIKYRTPVFLLSDAYLANGSEPWLCPTSRRSHRSTRISRQAAMGGRISSRYRRDEETLARPWAIPGTAGLEHRIGGLEKQDVTGNVSYDPDNHDLMVRLRAQRLPASRRTSRSWKWTIPTPPTRSSSAGAAPMDPWRRRCAASAPTAKKVAHAHLRYLNPFPRNTGEVPARLRQGACPGDQPGPAARSSSAPSSSSTRPGSTFVRVVPFRAGEVADAIDAMVDA